MKAIYCGIFIMLLSRAVSADCHLTSTQNNVSLGEHDISTLSRQSTLLHTAPLQYQLNCDSQVQLQGFTLQGSWSNLAGSHTSNNAALGYQSITIDGLRDESGELIPFFLNSGGPLQTRVQDQRLPDNGEHLQLTIPGDVTGQTFTLSLSLSSYAASATQLRRQQQDHISLSGQLRATANYAEP
ncbi:Uncharacterised protein [Serratia plymuthica]|nr:Uncharacterised protein [Serratia plymuthica]VEI20952.1 Uncharacterised protein [Serratia plymuthica]